MLAQPYKPLTAVSASDIAKLTGKQQNLVSAEDVSRGIISSSNINGHDKARPLVVEPTFAV